MSHVEQRRAAFPFRLFVVFVALLAFQTVAHAQSSPTGTLTGTIQDINGAAIPGVMVTAKQTDTGTSRQVTSDDDGRWTLPALAVGAYELTYEKQGFKRLVRQNVAVEASVPRTFDDKLEVGGLEGEVVNVTEGGATLLTPETATTFRQVTAEELVALPTSTRSFTQLLSTEAGVTTELSPVATNSNGNQSPSVNGTRTTSTSLFFNGVDATNITSNEGSLNDNISPAPETLQEVKLQTSLYDASTGRSGGGNFQLVTKAGGNNFNGSAYYYIQNEKFNANDFFFNKEGIDRPKARRNEGGFTIGGPVVKEKWFFFGGYQYTNAITGFVPTARSTTVLPLALRRITGDRTAQALADAFNAENGCAGSNCLLASDISPVALRLLNLRNPVTGDFIVPAPRAGGRLIGIDRAGARAFQFGTLGTGGITTRTIRENNPLIQQLNVNPSEFRQHQFTTRLDGRLTDKNTLTGTFFFSNFPGLDSFPDPSSLASPFSLKRDDRNRTLAISDQHIFGPPLINEARFGLFYLNPTRSLDDPFLTDEFTSAAAGITNPALLFDNSP
ncbi:MAG: carboxypeptidase regulatory-like domain-containing protein, partial [Rubrivivax sp.]|nr:carboxypeptidase regulatory-like domain-containing protein [Pyrinomonadaceae bacterium]